MAIEPLASVMSMQAQGSIPNKPTAPIEKAPGAESTAVQEAVKVDRTINVVDDSRNKGQLTGDGRDQQTKEQSNDQMRKAVETMNKKMQHSEAIFGIHEGTDRVMIKIVDRDTKEVIKEFPPEKTLDMIAKVWELAGIIVDEKR